MSDMTQTPQPAWVAQAVDRREPAPRTALRPAHRADGRTLAAVATVGLVAAAIGPRLPNTLGAALEAGTVLAACLSAGRPLPRHSRTLLVLAVAPLGLLVLRAAPQLALLNVVIAGTLVIAALSTAVAGRPWLQRPLAVALRLIELAGSVVVGPVYLASVLRPRTTTNGWAGTTTIRLARGLLLGLPVVLILAALLANGDAVFASVVDVRISLDGFGPRLAIGMMMAWAAVGLLRFQATPAGWDPTVPKRWLGSVEASTILGMMCAVFGLFAVVQVVAAVGGADEVLRTQGLTFSEYAREGFFQLIAVAALTALTIAGITASVRLDGQPDQQGSRTAGHTRIFSLVAVLLVLVVVGVALRRLDLYSDAFGLTRLRLWASVSTAWIGGVFGLLGVRLLGWRRAQPWLFPATVAWAILTSVLLVVANPDAQIAQTNLARAAAGTSFDVFYASRLSDDAVPVLLNGLDALQDDDAALLTERLCPRGLPFHPEDSLVEPGLLDFNASARRAAQACAAAAQ